MGAVDGKLASQQTGGLRYFDTGGMGNGMGQAQRPVGAAVATVGHNTATTTVTESQQALLRVVHDMMDKRAQLWGSDVRTDDSDAHWYQAPVALCEEEFTLLRGPGPGGGDGGDGGGGGGGGGGGVLHAGVAMSAVSGAEVSSLGQHAAYGGFGMGQMHHNAAVMGHGGMGGIAYSHRGGNVE